MNGIEKSIYRRLMVWAGIIFLLPTLILASLSLFSSKPENLGVSNGRLAACPDSPNCVSTQAEDEIHAIRPIEFTGSASDVLQAIKSTLAEMPRIRIVAEDGNYLHAEAISRIFRFVDDVEFWVDDERKQVHFRSASRVGRSDLGANRARMENFRSLFRE